MAKMENLDGGFEAKNFSYIYSLFIEKHCMQNKIIESEIWR